MIAAAKRSCLPQAGPPIRSYRRVEAEVLQAEEVLRSITTKKGLAEAQATELLWKWCLAGRPSRGGPGRRKGPTPGGVHGPRCAEGVVSVVSRPFVLGEEPRTALEQAVATKDKELIQAALAELKASGVSVRETTKLYALARADFG